MKMNVSIGLNIRGRVRVEKWSTERRQVFEFDNVILNVGWDHLVSRFNSNLIYPRFIYLGTGTSTPKATDLGLQSISTSLGSKYQTSAVFNGSILSKRGDVTLRFDYGEGEAAGTWTELGLGYWDGTGTEATRDPENAYVQPFNRALFRDQNDNPQAITVLGDEFLRIFVTLQMFFYYDEDEVFHWNFNGVPATSVHRKKNQNDNFYPLGALWNGGFQRSCVYGRLTGKPGTTLSYGVVHLTQTSNAQDMSINVVYNKTTVGIAESVGAIFWGGISRPILVIEHNFQRPGFADKYIACEDTERMTGSWGIQYFRACHVGAEGVATSGGVNSLTDSTKAWTVNDFQYKRIRIVAGTGEDQVRRIASNTSDTITVETDWDVTPDATSEYEVCLNG